MIVYRTYNVNNFKLLTPDSSHTYDNYQCSRCGKVLHKNFYTVNRIPYCTDCFNKLYNVHGKVMSVVDNIIDFTYIDDECNLSSSE